jgi:hypothetical protein
MARIQAANGPSDSQSHFSGKHSRSSILEIDSWMPSRIQAVSPLVDGLVRLIEGSQCFPGDEFDVELVLREAPENAVVHGNQPHNSSPRVFTSNVYSINGNPAGSAACAKLFAASSVLSWEESSLPCPVSRRAGNRPFLLLAPSTHLLSLGRRRIL